MSNKTNAGRTMSTATRGEPTVPATVPQHPAPLYVPPHRRAQQSAQAPLPPPPKGPTSDADNASDEYYCGPFPHLFVLPPLPALEAPTPGTVATIPAALFNPSDPFAHWRRLPAPSWQGLQMPPPAPFPGSVPRAHDANEQFALYRYYTLAAPQAGPDFPVQNAPVVAFCAYPGCAHGFKDVFVVWDHMWTAHGVGPEVLVA